MTPATLMKTVADAFSKADFKPLFDAIDDNIVWKSASTVEGVFRFGGEYKDRLGVIEATSKISTAYFSWHFEPKEIVASGDVVWGLFRVEAEYRAIGKKATTGLPVKFDCAFRWKMRDSKIVEHQAFFDTASVLMQQGEFPKSAERTA